MATTPKKSLPGKTIKPKYIYWCHTDLPEDYIFLYGSSVLQVKKTYNWLGGFEGNDHIIVHQVCEIPQAVLKEMKIKKASDVAEDELVLKSGVELLHKDGSAFRYNGRIYREAGVLDDKHNENELAVYLFKQKDKIRYKIGHSKSVSRRLKEVSKPDQFEIFVTIRTKSARKLESEIRGYFKRFQVYNEYIELDVWGGFLLETIFMLYSTEFFNADSHHTLSKMFKDTLVELTEMIRNHKINTLPARDIEIKGIAIRKLIDDRSEKEGQERWGTHIKNLTRPMNEEQFPP